MFRLYKLDWQSPDSVDRHLCAVNVEIPASDLLIQRVGQFKQQQRRSKDGYLLGKPLARQVIS